MRDLRRKIGGIILLIMGLLFSFIFLGASLSQLPKLIALAKEEISGYSLGYILGTAVLYSLILCLAIACFYYSRKLLKAKNKTTSSILDEDFILDEDSIG